MSKGTALARAGLLSAGAIITAYLTWRISIDGAPPHQQSPVNQPSAVTEAHTNTPLIQSISGSATAASSTPYKLSSSAILMPNLPSQKPTTTMKEVRGKNGPLPTLLGMADQKAVIQSAVRDALNGDNRAAIALSHISRNVLILDQTPGSHRASVVPSDVRDDSLYWLSVAADRGDTEAQLMYVNAVQSTGRQRARLPGTVNSSLLESAEARARSYLQAVIEEGVADGVKFLSAAFRDGLLGLQVDPVQAHAALIVLSHMMPSNETAALLSTSAAKLRRGDVEAAERLAATGAVWKVGW